MSDVMMKLSETVSDARGIFRARAMARQRGDGSWEGWLEFLPTDSDRSIGCTTPIETLQHDRVTMERWASGLTRVYAEGALSRARTHNDAIHTSERLLALLEIVDALDRRIPPIERAGETGIAIDAARLRESAVERIAHLRGQGAGTVP
jgi:hypothetical protein